MAPLFEYFVVCGIGPEIRTLDGSNGYYGMNYVYEPSLIDQYPRSDHSLYAPLPPELPMCVMPAGVEFYKSGLDANDPPSYPRSYPIVLTEIALVLSQVNSTECTFDAQAFTMHWCRSNNQEPDPMVAEFLLSQGFSNHIEKVLSSGESNDNVLDKLIDAIGRGESLMSLYPSSHSDLIIITIPDPIDGVIGGAKYTYSKFPANIRGEGEDEKRKQILKDIKDKDDEEKGLILDIKVKLQGLWISLLDLGDADVILSSDEYETILALLETDAKGIVGRTLIEWMEWSVVSEEQFVAVKEMVKELITCATYQNDMPTLREALEVSAEMYRKDFNNVSDYVQRHLISLSIWEDTGFWEAFFESLMEQSLSKSSSNESVIMSQLILIASHMIQLRGYLSYIHQLQMVYWGISDLKAQSLSSSGLQSPHFRDATVDNQPSKASTIAKNWVRSMFGRESVLKVNSFSHARGWTFETETAAVTEIGTPRKQNFPNSGLRRSQTNVRVLKGHHKAITALHCVTRREVWDLTGDREDTGFFISGSTDCSVKIWDPSHHGSELRATLRGHTGAVRAISSDREKVVSGSDDLSIVIWDKHEFIPLEELKGHEAQISSVRMLSGDRSVLCMEYNDATGILAAAGRDKTVHIWDIRAGSCDAILASHGGPVLCVEYSALDGGIITGSDDGSVRFWENSAYNIEYNSMLLYHQSQDRSGGWQLYRTPHFSASVVRCVASDLDRKTICSGGRDGRLRLWDATINI
uniref:uDENN domain-containing protein n=1 Tax=Chenopodium quinoa TaxID=63459 RepID=A0A803NCD2_CHEQI